MDELGALLGTGHGHGERKFRFEAMKGHFTFPGHIDMDILAKKAVEVGGGNPLNVMRISIVHELGSETERGLTETDSRRYEHTHMAVQWRKKVDKTSARFMDVEVPIDFEQSEQVHPNIQCKKSAAWFKGLFYEYHRGKKAKIGGGFTQTEPVKLKQAGMEGWEDDAEMMNDIVRAPTLIDACMIASVVPKSVSCVAQLRAAVKKRGCETALSSCDRPWREPPADWDRKTQSLLIIGGTNKGKTNFAINLLGPHAYVIRGLDNLHRVPQHATGLVFDDQDYYKENIQDQKMIFDCRIATTIHAGAYTAKDKPCLPAIFTSNNLGRLLNLDADDGALRTRTYVWEIPDNEIMYE